MVKLKYAISAGMFRIYINYCITSQISIRKINGFQYKQVFDPKSDTMQYTDCLWWHICNVKKMRQQYANEMLEICTFLHHIWFSQYILLKDGRSTCDKPVQTSSTMPWAQSVPEQCRKFVCISLECHIWQQPCQTYCPSLWWQVVDHRLHEIM